MISASSAFAQVTMQLTAPPPGPSLDGVYISPYTATIDGVSTSVICDDFSADISPSTPPWTANVTKLSSIQGETSADTVLKFDPTSAAQQQSDYTVAAILATEIFAAQTSGDALAQGELSFALWSVFESSAVSSYLTSVSPIFSDSLTTLAAATSYLNAAKALAAPIGSLTPGSYSNVTVYTPTPLSASQEFITVSMPEPSSPELLVLYLTGVAGLVFVVKRRNAVVIS
jgi:hypothetical protein